jgi:MFS family permease
VVLLVGLAGIFGAGIDLTFFDTLVSSYPPDMSAMFVGMYQATVYVATFVAPLIATAVSEYVGIPEALVIGGALRLLGCGLLATMVK